MLDRLFAIAPYVEVFTVFNFTVFLFYYLYGWIVLKKRYIKNSHTALSKNQKKYLTKIQFVNVQRPWLKKYYKIVRNYSLIYFFAAEILCFIAMYITERKVLICRIALFADFALLLFWIYLVFYFKKKNEELSEQHKEDLEKAIDEYYKTYGEEKETTT